MHQHRLYLGPVRPDGDPADCHRYWRLNHRQTVRGADFLLGYVQNRLLPTSWNPYLVCAETWFETRADEAAFYDAEYFHTVIIPDELRIIDRDASWNSAVTRIDVQQPGPRGPWRALCFGASPEVAAGAARVEVIGLRRPVRDGDEPHAVSAWTGTRAEAEEIAARAGGISFAANAVPVVGPPEDGWEAVAEVDGAF